MPNTMGNLCRMYQIMRQIIEAKRRSAVADRVHRLPFSSSFKLTQLSHPQLGYPNSPIHRRPSKPATRNSKLAPVPPPPRARMRQTIQSKNVPEPDPCRAKRRSAGVDGAQRTVAVSGTRRGEATIPTPKSAQLGVIRGCTSPCWSAKVGQSQDQETLSDRQPSLPFRADRTRPGARHLALRAATGKQTKQAKTG
jgi:hypothetical protein